MTPLLIFMLAGSFFVQPTNSIQCYTCNMQLKNENCKTAIDCPPAATTCKTDVISVVGFVNLITKECVSDCDTSFKDFSVGKRNISCCSVDRCNLSGSHALRVNSLHVALAVLASFTCLFLGNRL